MELSYFSKVTSPTLRQHEPVLDGRAERAWGRGGLLARVDAAGGGHGGHGAVGGEVLVAAAVGGGGGGPPLGGEHAHQVASQRVHCKLSDSFFSKHSTQPLIKRFCTTVHQGRSILVIGSAICPSDMHT